MLAHFSVDLAYGLSSQQVIQVLPTAISLTPSSQYKHGCCQAVCMQARGVHGANQLSPEKGKPFWKLILKQFDDYLVKVIHQKYKAITFNRAWKSHSRSQHGFTGSVLVRIWS